MRLILLSISVTVILCESVSDESDETVSDILENQFCTKDTFQCDDKKYEINEEEKQKYEKIKWTDDKDYIIRDELDKADDKIANEPETAVEMFQKILVDNPLSGRAKYALARTRQLLIWRMNNTDEKSLLCSDTTEDLKKIFNIEINDFLYKSAGHLLLNLAETDCRDGHSKHHVIEALQILTKKEADERYSAVLCHDLFIEGRYDEATNTIDKVLVDHPQIFLLNLLKTTAMKVGGDQINVKAANKILRDLDYDEVVERLDNSKQKENHALLIFDLNYIGTELTRKHKSEVFRIMTKDASRLHLIPSALQRPFEYISELKSQPIWELMELKAQNRWTNIQSITGLESLPALLSKLDMENIKKESINLSENVKESDQWIKDDLNWVSQGTVYQRNLFIWGKKKHMTCSIAQVTCKIIKNIPDSSQCKKCISRFVIVDPDTITLPRVGPSNTRLRAILPLVVPADGKVGIKVGDKEVSMKEGEIIVMDDSFENILWNETKERVLLLSLDFHHPDLKDRMKKNGQFTEYIKNKFVHY